MNKIISFPFFFLLVLLTSHSPAQITATLLPYSGCPGELPVPVELQNCNGVASISLKIVYDTVVLHYDTVTDVNPLLNGGFFLSNHIENLVILSWFSLNPIDLGNSNLAILHFHHLINKTTQLAWMDDSTGTCVFTDLDGIELQALFIDAP
ncbi:MAG: hypothetical protein NTU44_08270, partial [Bacteroidetes bacterium]|nr:hypothetical protein [Bacteroidota bacterium]